MSVTDSTIERYTAADPDVRLMLRVRDDDAAAFEQLVIRYQTRLIRILEHLVGRRGNAEDLAQETFLRVYRARKSYQPGARFSTWLFFIAKNVARNALRNQGRRHEVNVGPNTAQDTSSGPSLDQMALEESGLNPSRQFARGELAEVIAQALETLGERQKMAILLNKFEEMNYAEIAEAMELSVSATKSLLMRARVNLKDALTPYLQSGILPEGLSPSDGSPSREDPTSL